MRHPSLWTSSRGRNLAALLLALLAVMGVACRDDGAKAQTAVGGTFVEVEPAGHTVLLYPNALNLRAKVTVPGGSRESLDFEWSRLTGPGSVEFSHPGEMATQATFSVPGDYVLRFNMGDGPNTVHSDLRVQVVVPDATYFVSPEGNDEADGRSIDRPFRTIHKAASVVGPGDVVMLRAGIYEEYNLVDSWVTSGTPGHPITFMGYPGEAAVIDGSHRPRSDSSPNPSAPELIRLVNLDWYVFQDLTIRNSSGRGIGIEGNHHVLRNITSHSNHGDGIFIRGNDNLIENSLVFDNYSRSNEGESADGVKIDSGTRNVVRRVVSYSNSDDGFDLWASTETLVEYSIAHHNGRGRTGNGNGFKVGSEGVDAHSTIRFNVSHSNRGHNFTDNGGGGLVFFNNTSWNAGIFGFVVRGRPGMERSELLNNISFEDSRGVLIDIQTRGGELPLSKTNTWDLGIDDPGFLTTRMTEVGFLKLAGDGAAVDVGTDVGYGYRGRAMDLGAFESSLGN